jgi:hypothetical protein
VPGIAFLDKDVRLLENRGSSRSSAKGPVFTKTSVAFLMLLQLDSWAHGFLS